VDPPKVDKLTPSTSTERDKFPRICEAYHDYSYLYPLLDLGLVDWAESGLSLLLLFCFLIIRWTCSPASIYLLPQILPSSTPYYLLSVRDPALSMRLSLRDLPKPSTTRLTSLVPTFIFLSLPSWTCRHLASIALCD
jgi:hypothetical protein